MKSSPWTATNAYKKLFPPSEEEVRARFIIENDEAVIFDHLRFAEQIFPNHGLMLCPVSHATSKYVSINCETVLGHRFDALSKMELADFFSLHHPEDLPLVQQCFDFIRNIQPYDPANYRFVMFYRMMNEKGKYEYIKNENLAIKTSSNTYIYLMLFSNISAEQKFHHVKLEVQQNRNGKFIQTFTYNPNQLDKEITPRQNEIVQWIMKGFTNKEVADKLGVSVFTVKNHKRMLFKKINVKNNMELANYVRRGDR